VRKVEAHRPEGHPRASGQTPPPPARRPYEEGTSVGAEGERALLSGPQARNGSWLSAADRVEQTALPGALAGRQAAVRREDAAGDAFRRQGAQHLALEILHVSAGPLAP